MNGGIFIQILIWGQDPRFVILELELKKRYSVYRCCDINVDIQRYDIIILPMNGINNYNFIELLNNSKKSVIIYTGLKKNLENVNRKVVSFLDDTYIRDENDSITVDGIIHYIKNNGFDKICLLGYGHIGKKLYQKLCNKIVSIGIIEEYDKLELGEISFYTSDNYEFINRLKNCDLIVNTVPHNIITDDIGNNLKIPILDIASSPYGVSREVVDKYSLNYYLYSGIPGKYDPIKAGKILLRKIIRGE